MLIFIHHALLYGHMATGIAAMVLFWFAIFATKGSPLHRRSGRYFNRMMLATSLAGVVMALMSLSLARQLHGPFAASPGFTGLFLFLLLLSWLAFHGTFSGELALRQQHSRHYGQIASAAILLILGSVMLWVGASSFGLAAPIFSCLAIVLGGVQLWWNWHHGRLNQRQRLGHHISHQLAAVSAIYVAFFAAAGRQGLLDFLPEQAQFLPWVIPALLARLLAWHYKRHWLATSRQLA